MALMKSNSQNTNKLNGTLKRNLISKRIQNSINQTKHLINNNQISSNDNNNKQSNK